MSGFLPPFLSPFLRAMGGPFDGVSGVGPGESFYGLDARFLYYSGVLDQSLSDQQVLGKAQGVWVGSLILEDSASIGMNPVPSISGGQVILGARQGDSVPSGWNSNLYANAFASRVKGNYLKGGFYVPHGAITTNSPGLAISNFEPPASGVAGNYEIWIYSGFDYVLDMRDSAGNIYPTPHTLSPGDYVEALLIDGGGSNYYGYYRVDGVPWTLHLISAAAETLSCPGFIVNETTAGIEQILEYMDVGTDAGAILDAAAGLGPVDPATEALIDALRGDVVSASFGPASDDNTLTISVGDELHDDYPTNGVGKILRGSLRYTNSIPNAGTAKLSVGRLDFAEPGGDLRDTIVEIDPNTRVSGLTVKGRVTTAIEETCRPACWFAGVSGDTPYYNTTYYDMRPRVGSIVRPRVMEIGVGITEEPDIPIPSFDWQEFHDYEVTLGGFNSAGEPAPDDSGDYGAIFRVDGQIIYTTSLYSYDNLHAGSGDWAGQTLIDTLQTRVDRGILATPQRALFNVSGDIDDYEPEDGVKFVNADPAKLKIENNKLTNKLSAQGSIANFKNAGGYCWEFAVSTNSSSSFAYLMFRMGGNTDNYMAVQVSGDSLNDVRLVQRLNESTSYPHSWTLSTPGAKVATRFIVLDDGKTITIICPSTGDVFQAENTAVNSPEQNAGVYWNGGNVNNAYGIDWFVARTGKVEEFDDGGAGGGGVHIVNIDPLHLYLEDEGWSVVHHDPLLVQVSAGPAGPIYDITMQNVVDCDLGHLIPPLAADVRDWRASIGFPCP